MSVSLTSIISSFPKSLPSNDLVPLYSQIISFTRPFFKSRFNPYFISSLFSCQNRIPHLLVHHFLLPSHNSFFSPPLPLQSLLSFGILFSFSFFHSFFCSSPLIFPPNVRFYTPLLSLFSSSSFFSPYTLSSEQFRLFHFPSLYFHYYSFLPLLFSLIQVSSIQFPLIFFPSFVFSFPLLWQSQQ